MTALAQTSSNDETAVRTVVDTYLAKKDTGAVERTLSPGAKIISVDGRGRVIETPIGKPAKLTRGMMVLPSQSIVAVDIASDGATVKVQSDFSAGPLAVPAHFQFISLLKIGGEWRIVSILMPPGRLAN